MAQETTLDPKAVAAHFRRLSESLAYRMPPSCGSNKPRPPTSSHAGLTAQSKDSSEASVLAEMLACISSIDPSAIDDKVFAKHQRLLLNDFVAVHAKHSSTAPTRGIDYLLDTLDTIVCLFLNMLFRVSWRVSKRQAAGWSKNFPLKRFWSRRQGPRTSKPPRSLSSTRPKVQKRSSSRVALLVLVSWCINAFILFYV